MIQQKTILKNGWFFFFHGDLYKPCVGSNNNQPGLMVIEQTEHGKWRVFFIEFVFAMFC